MISDLQTTLILWTLKWPVATTVFEVGLRAMMVVVVALVTVHLSRRQPAALRRLIWLGSLAVLLIVGCAGAVVAIRDVVNPASVWLGSGAQHPTIWPVQPAVLPLWIWVIPAGLLLLRLLISQVRLKKLLRDCVPVASAEWRRDADTLSEELGLRAPVEVLVSRCAYSPVTVGVWRSTVVIPSSFVAAGASLRKSVLLHELTHAQRHDVAGRWLASISCALHWYNPLVWLAARRLRSECEHVSDDAVLAGGIAGSVYARHLFDLADTMAPHPSALVTLGIGASELRKRIEAIAEKRNRRDLNHRTRMALAIALASMLFLSFQASVPRPQLRFMADERSEAATSVGWRELNQVRMGQPD